MTDFSFCEKFVQRKKNYIRILVHTGLPTKDEPFKTNRNPFNKTIQRVNLVFCLEYILFMDLQMIR